MQILALLLFILSASAFGQTPFERYFSLTPRETNAFYEQTPRKAYPFTISEASEAQFDLTLFTAEYPVDAMNARSALFKNTYFSNKIFQYHYTFPIAKNWEMLPHPYVERVEHPSHWIEHFKPKQSHTSKINTLAFHQELSTITGTQAYVGHELKLFKTPYSYQELMKRLERTREHAFFSTYLFHCDSGSAPLLDLIEKKSHQGVQIFIIYDRFYSKSDPSCAQKLRARGAKVALHSNGQFMKIFHEKMYVFDGEYALIDGQNIIAIQTKSSGVNNLLNDIGVGIKGALVTKIAERFITHWEDILGGEIPQKIKAHYQEKALSLSPFSTEDALRAALEKPTQQGICRLVTKNPGKENSQILDMYLHTIKNTNHYLFFNYMDAQPSNAKLSAPGGRILKAVSDLSRLHPTMRVDMLTNNWKTPTNVTLPRAESAYRNRFTRMSVALIEKLMPPRLGKIKKRLLSMEPGANLNWWSYSQYMHSKTLMSDNLWTIIGTHNLNKASENSSYELSVACLDSGLAQEMQHSIATDLLNSLPVPLE